MKLRQGDKITVKFPVECYYYDLGQHVILNPGDVAIVNSIAPKVRITKGLGKDSKPYFIVCDAKDQRFGVNFCNALNVK